MKKLISLSLLLFFSIAFSKITTARTDSLVLFSDLSFHSKFEKKAFRNFTSQKTDAFNMFLAIDEHMAEKEAGRHREMFMNVLRDLEDRKIQDKKIKKKIKLSYSIVHSRFLRKYNENEYFPGIFTNGIYNCVTASMLYALVFDHLGIPYKLKASPGHVYLVANPGSKSIVIETTNPGFEKKIFTGEFKQQYVNYLRTSKLISESEFRTKSVEEIFEEKFKEVKDAEFDCFPGFQYYNMALYKLQDNATEEAVRLCQKAYFFYPDNQVKTLLYTSLLFQIEKCIFDKVSDIDYLAQLARFENTDRNAIIGIFGNIINHHLQYTDREDFCDSLKSRLVSQLKDRYLVDEINFSYNLQMSYRLQNSDKVEKYVARALAIKGNHRDARRIMDFHLNKKLFEISDIDALMDTINNLEVRYNLVMIKSILKEHRLRAYLQKADNLFLNNKINEGDKFLSEFEENCEAPVKSPILSTLVENAYRKAAVYYFYRGRKSQAKSYIDRGLKYVPGSRLLESAVY